LNYYQLYQIPFDESFKNQVQLDAMKVLLVEDSPVNQLVTSALLTNIGVEHVIAENGLLALDLLVKEEGREIGLILMDCQMPELNGLKATKFIRRGYAGTDHKLTPIVALTGSNDEEDRLLCLDAGMDDFLSKPIDIEALAAIIRRLIG
jgi:two-component system, sensor histidine kinase and response regulator